MVIVGDGFGGMANCPASEAGHAEVTVVDRHNHLLFQPLIYQVAAGALSGGQVAAPLRHMLKRQPNATVLMAAVTDVDVERRQVVLDRGERLDYDSLIVACGGETFVLRPRRMARGHVRAEDARRRGGPPRPDLRRV